MITVQDIFNRVDDQRRDATDGTIDINKKYRALTAILDIMSARANWKFAIRRTTFQFLDGSTDYNIENVLGVEDFKEVALLHPQNDESRQFSRIEDDAFARAAALQDDRDLCTVAWVDGRPTLRLNHRAVKPRRYLHTGDSLTNDGTWSADTSTSDAMNLDVTDNELDGEALTFDIDVSQSGNNRATIYLSAAMTAQDLTEFINAGKVRMQVYLPAALATYMTSIQVYYGNSNSAYYLSAATGPSNGGTWQTGKNEVQFDWGTESGSPDITAIDYLEIRFNYSASMTDATGVRVRAIEMVYPERMELHYYSSWLVETSAGERQEGAENATDVVLLPKDEKETIVEGVLWQIMDQMGSNSSKDSKEHRMLFEYGSEYDSSKSPYKRFGGMRGLIRKYGASPVAERRKLRIKRIE